MATFDVNDRESWYFGSMSRQEAADLLMNEKEGGVFLVRDSKTICGDYVLCVREDTKVSHYIINRIPAAGPNQFMYRIGDQNFPDLPELLGFYKLHYLDTTPLRRPAKKIFERVICKFDFKAGDSDDLPFKKGEVLEIINKDEEQWWTARNAQGQTGQIPVPYVEKYCESGPQSQQLGSRNLGNLSLPQAQQQQQHTTVDGASQHHPATGFQNQSNTQHSLKKSNLNRKLPALARVKQARVPNAYDKTALKLEVGDIITVTKMNINGQWEGELKGRTGHFPFTHVEFIDQIADGDLNDLDSGGGGVNNNNGASSRHCGNVNSSLILNNSSSLIDDK